MLAFDYYELGTNNVNANFSHLHFYRTFKSDLNHPPCINDYNLPPSLLH